MQNVYEKAMLKKGDEIFPTLFEVNIVMSSRF